MTTALIVATTLLFAITLFSTVTQLMLMKHVRAGGWKAVSRQLVNLAVCNLFLSILTWVATAIVAITWAIHIDSSYVGVPAAVATIAGVVFIVWISLDANDTLGWFDKQRKMDEPFGSR